MAALIRRARDPGISNIIIKSLVQKLFIFELNFLYINIADTIRNISVLTEILPVTFYLFFKKRIFIKSLGTIILLSTLYFINDVYALYLLYYRHKSNFLFYNIVLLIETICLYYFFYLIIKDHFFKKILFFISIIFTVFWVFSFFKFGNKSYYWSCINFENISVLAIAIFYYYEQIIIINSAFIYAESVFWVVTAYLIYIAGTFFLYLYIPSFNSEEQKNYYDILNSIFTIIRTVLISVAIFIKPGFSKIERIN